MCQYTHPQKNKKITQTRKELPGRYEENRKRPIPWKMGHQRVLRLEKPTGSNAAER